MTNFKEKLFAVAIVAILVSAFMAQDFFGARESRIIFCDVGQGSGAIIALRGGLQIIVDAGPSNKFSGCVGRNMPYFDRRIELMVISHPDKDHFVGAIELLKKYRVERVLVNNDVSGSGEYKVFSGLANDKLRKVGAGEQIKIGGAEIDFLSPGKDYKNDNKNSLFFKFSYGDKKAIFTGDAPTEIEDGLVRDGADLRADILQIAHHGSEDSFSKKFFEAVGPELAIISVGKDNKYGHPSGRVVKALKNLNVRYFRTDEAGDITVPLE
jgi:competence protein ComEC